MKKLWKRNQIMITALALMIAIAGYLNFMGKKVDEENLFTTSAQFEETSGVTTEGGTDMAAVTDITDESLALLPEQENGAIDESAAMTDIDSMDSEDEMVYSDYLDENQAENVSAAADDAALDETAMAGTDENAASGEVAQITWMIRDSSVAAAAPRTPMAGSPSSPKMKIALKKMLKTTAEELITAPMVT